MKTVRSDFRPLSAGDAPNRAVKPQSLHQHGEEYDDLPSTMRCNAAACIGCGACVAACPNASASLFAGSKITHLGLLPQGRPERDSRVIRMVEQMDVEGFGGCSWFAKCQEACPKEISIDAIKQMYADFITSSLRNGGTRS